MLDGRGDDSAARLSEGVRNSKYCLVVGLGSPAREDDLIGGCANEIRHALPCPIHASSCLLAEPVNARGIPVMIAKMWEHLLQDFGMKPRS